ncbi:hypothetical protein BB561_005720 [Smittium simulii]|uniref:Uncharacterized protein n=1 Tax=Smittium simulii TaxID=133385 RepID=A0A2T9Y8U8_9FUNG|nr:hypothetical protein BB561_005720 [Smittium simulii]
MEPPLGRVVEIPLEGSENVLEIDCSQLPESSYDICEVLEQENSDIKFYLIFSLEYYKQKKTDEAILLLKRGLSKDTPLDSLSKLPLINFLANIYIQKAKRYHFFENAKILSIYSSKSNQLQDESAIISQIDFEKIKSGREAFFQLAIALFKEADRIQPDNITTQLGKGVLYLTSRKYNLALQFFNSTLQTSPKSIGALIGKAKTLYAQKLYLQALNSYQQVLLLNSDCELDPRIGIGLCFYKLGKVKEAALAFEKSIQINDKNLAPHVLLSLVKQNSVKARVSSDFSIVSPNPVDNEHIRDELKQAMEYLKKSYLLDPDNPVVLICMSRIFFYRNDYEKATEAAIKAFALSVDNIIQAEAQFQLARILHATQKYEKAYELYQKALKLNSEHPLARLGLGQIQVYKAEMAAAILNFQTLLTRFPKCIELLHYLGFIHSTLSNQKLQAVEYYEFKIKTIASAGDESWNGDWYDKLDVFLEPDVFLECAYLLENIDISKAKKFYMAARDILKLSKAQTDLHKHKNSYILVEILNNIGVLDMLNNQNATAVEELNSSINMFEKLQSDTLGLSKRDLGINSLEESTDTLDLDQRFNNIDATILYNLGRAYESLSNYEKAEEIYNKLISKFPHYINGLLRLGVIYLNVKKSYKKSNEYFEQAYTLNPSNITTLLLQSELKFISGDLHNGRKMLENILKNIEKHDLYTLLSLGNYYLKAVRSEMSSINQLKQTHGLEIQNSEDNENKIQKSSDKHDLSKISLEYKKHVTNLSATYKRAHEFLKKCLTLNPKCMFAANGFAAVLAERGYYSHAKDIFISIRVAQVSCSIENSFIGGTSITNTIPNNSTTGSSNNTFGVGISNLDSLLNLSTGFELPDVLGGQYSHESGLITCSNLAHVYVELGEYRTAINLYESCIKKIRSKINKYSNMDYTSIYLADLRNLQLCLSRALYIQARSNKSILIMQQAVDHLSSLCLDFEKQEPENQLNSNYNILPQEENNNNSILSSDLSDKSSKISIAESKTELDKQSSTSPISEPKPPFSSTNSKKSNKPNIKDLPTLTVSKYNNMILVDGLDPVIIYNLALARQNLAQMVSELPPEQFSTEEFDTVLAGLNESNTTFSKLSLIKQPLSKLLRDFSSQKNIKNNQKLKDHTQLEVARHPPKFPIDPKFAIHRASYGKYIFSSLQKKIQTHINMEKQKKEQAEASRKRRYEQQAQQEAEREATLQAQQKQEDLLLEQTKLRNDLLRAEMSKPSYGMNTQANDGYISTDDPENNKMPKQRKRATKTISNKKRTREHSIVDKDYDSDINENDERDYNRRYDKLSRRKNRAILSGSESNGEYKFNATENSKKTIDEDQRSNIATKGYNKSQKGDDNTINKKPRKSLKRRTEALKGKAKTTERKKKPRQFDAEQHESLEYSDSEVLTTKRKTQSKSKLYTAAKTDSKINKSTESKKNSENPSFKAKENLISSPFNNDDLFGNGSDLSSLSDISSGFNSDAALSS